MKIITSLFLATLFCSSLIPQQVIAENGSPLDEVKSFISSLSESNIEDSEVREVGEMFFHVVRANAHIQGAHIYKTRGQDADARRELQEALSGIAIAENIIEEVSERNPLDFYLGGMFSDIRSRLEADRVNTEDLVLNMKDLLDMARIYFEVKIESKNTPLDKFEYNTLIYLEDAKILSEKISFLVHERDWERAGLAAELLVETSFQLSEEGDGFYLNQKELFWDLESISSDIENLLEEENLSTNTILTKVSEFQVLAEELEVALEAEQ